MGASSQNSNEHDDALVERSRLQGWGEDNLWMEEHSLYPGDLHEHQIWRERSHQQELEGGIPGKAENNQ